MTTIQASISQYPTNCINSYFTNQITQSYCTNQKTYIPDTAATFLFCEQDMCIIIIRNLQSAFRISKHFTTYRETYNAQIPIIIQISSIHHVYQPLYNATSTYTECTKQMKIKKHLHTKYGKNACTQNRACTHTHG